MVVRRLVSRNPIRPSSACHCPPHSRHHHHDRRSLLCRQVWNVSTAFWDLRAFVHQRDHLNRAHQSPFLVFSKQRVFLSIGSKIVLRSLCLCTTWPPHQPVPSSLDSGSCSSSSPWDSTYNAHTSARAGHHTTLWIAQNTKFEKTTNILDNWIIQYATTETTRDIGWIHALQRQNKKAATFNQSSFRSMDH